MLASNAENSRAYKQARATAPGIPVDKSGEFTFTWGTRRALAAGCGEPTVDRGRQPRVQDCAGGGAEDRQGTREAKRFFTPKECYDLNDFGRCKALKDWTSYTSQDGNTSRHIWRNKETLERPKFSRTGIDNSEFKRSRPVKCRVA